MITGPDNMKKPPTTSSPLRHRAEVRLRKARSQTGVPTPETDPQRLVHELQVHQVELEMQNAELQEARDQMEILLEKSTDLYDFAPIGYFSLDEHGRILDVNLTGAAMLRVERSQLVNRGLQQFVAPASRPNFQRFLEKVFMGGGKQICETSLLTEDGAEFCADLQAVWAALPRGTRKWCRVAASDITALKRAEELQRRATALTLMNQELTREIVQRKAVEQALKKSEQHQIRLLEQSRQMQEQLRHVSHQILLAQEEERKRISRELHDGISQTLVGINVHLEALSQEVTINPRQLKRKIAQTQRLVEKSVDIVHEFARELRPTALDDLGLIVTLHSYMKDFMKRTGIHVKFTTFAGVEQFDGSRKTVVYRVVQEALTNVARHAGASRVIVTIRKLADIVAIEIADNGKSFKVEEVLDVKKNKRLGLLGMRERVEMVGGTLLVESSPGQGTTLRAQIPLKESPAGVETRTPRAG